MFSSNRVLPSLRRTGVWREFLTGLLLATQLLLPAYGTSLPWPTQGPSWWETRGVIIPGKASDDFAVINQGQLKYLVSAVVAEMNAKLTDGAGPSLNALVNAWTTSTAGADDFAVVNVGQLKTVTKAVYQRLLAAGAIEALPAWATDNGGDDFAVANIGQAKHLFAFEVPDQKVNSSLTMHALYVQQAVVADHNSPFGLFVYFEQAGQAVPSVPVTFEVFQGQGGLVDYSNWGVGPQTTLGLQSDEYGYAGCEFKAGLDAGYSWVRASTAGGLTQWFLMITNGGGEEEFPTNPIGVTEIEFKKDSDEDGDSDVDEIAEGKDAKDDGSFIPDWKFRSVNMKFQAQFDFWDTSRASWLQPVGEQNWFTCRSKLIHGVSFYSGYELYGPLKPTLYDCPVLETFVKPAVNSSGWRTDTEKTVAWSDSFNFNPFYMEHYLEDAALEEVRSVQARSGEHNGYDYGQYIVGRSWVSSAVKLELRSSKPRPRSFTAMAVVERRRISYTEGSSGVTMDITTTVVDGFTLTLPAGAQTSESIVLSYPPELNCVDYYDVKYLPLEVKQPTINADGGVGGLAQVQELRMCRWNSPRIANDQVDRAAFATLDPDRIVIRLPVPSKKGAPSVKVQVSTRTGTYTPDAGAELDFKAEGAGSEYFVSDSLVIVTDEEDDDLTVGTGADNELGDRTFRARPGGKLHIECADAGNLSADITIKKFTHKFRYQNIYVGMDANALAQALPCINTNNLHIWQFYAQEHIEAFEELPALTITEADLQAKIPSTKMFAFLSNAAIKELPSLVPSIPSDVIKVFWLPPPYELQSATGAGGANLADDEHPEICAMFLKNLNQTPALMQKYAGSTAHELGHALGLAMTGAGDHQMPDGTRYPPWTLMCHGLRSNFLIPNSPDQSAKHWNLKDGSWMRASPRFIQPTP